jgi:hypothetical protein
LQTQAEQSEDHLVALGHGSHDQDNHRDQEKKEKAEVDGEQKTPAHANEEGHVRHSQKHGGAGAAAE